MNSIVTKELKKTLKMEGKMKTSEIKKTIENEFNTFAPHPIMTIATNYIMGIPSPAFWTHEAKPYIGKAIALVMEFAKTGLLIEGSEGNKIAKINQETGEIIISKRKE